MYHQQTNWSQQIIEQAKIIQKVVSPEVYKLNHAVMTRKQGGQMQSSEKKMFFQKKRLEKRKWIYTLVNLSSRWMDCDIKWDNRFICLNMFIMQRRKTALR